MVNAQKQLRLWQTLCILAYILIIALAHLGTASLDMDIVYVMAPMDGHDPSFTADLTLDVSEKLLLIGITVVEFLLFCTPKHGLKTCGAILCAIRALPTMFPLFLGLLSLIFRGDMLEVDLTVFTYLVALLCVASFICHIINRKQCPPATPPIDAE